MSTEIIVTLIGSTEAVITVFGMYFVNRYFQLKDKKKIHKVEEGIDLSSKLAEKLNNIREQVEATRVNLWVFHNGGYYYTGEPIQKLSCIAESHDMDVKSQMQDFQNIPIHVFLRHLDKLRNTTSFYEYNELQYRDNLSKLNESYDIASLGGFKINNKKGDWVAILTVGYSNHRELEDTEKTYIEFQLNQISDIAVQLG